MSIQKNEFFEIEQKKIMEIHEKFRTRDEEGKVHCCDCPYSTHNSYHCDCLFAVQLNKAEVEHEVD